MSEEPRRMPGSGLPLNPDGRYFPSELRDLSGASEVEIDLEDRLERARFRTDELATVQLRTSRNADGYYHWTASPRGEARRALQAALLELFEGSSTRCTLWHRQPSPEEVAAGRYRGFLVQDLFGPEPPELSDQPLFGAAEVVHSRGTVLIRVYRESVVLADPLPTLTPEEVAASWDEDAVQEDHAREFLDPECRIENLLLDLFREAGLEHALRETGAPGYEGEGCP